MLTFTNFLSLSLFVLYICICMYTLSLPLVAHTKYCIQCLPWQQQKKAQHIHIIKHSSLCLFVCVSFFIHGIVQINFWVEFFSICTSEADFGSISYMVNCLCKIFEQKYSKYVTSNFDVEKRREANNRFRQSRLISFDYCSHLEVIVFCVYANNTTFSLMNTNGGT